MPVLSIGKTIIFNFLMFILLLVMWLGRNTPVVWTGVGEALSAQREAHGIIVKMKTSYGIEQITSTIVQDAFLAGVSKYNCTKFQNGTIACTPQSDKASK